MTGLTVDRLDGEAVQVLRMEGARFGGEAAREPHRHDYHELIWLRDGRGQHSIDGATVPVRPHTVTVIVPGRTGTVAPSIECRPAPARIQISSW